ncbi:TniQ protein [Malonomonas rubra DSM 5091]|uniref:TniQ protein n=1 Tax=Malonomonas rubra DSM 5091 TaxID=1122189 RepID=A0A1M6H824_MALRU|nr:TniQ family protein [Malonomonas rubra]SHJ18357.1 TniQ protein [Malonomonas rubra DSM 5091]
MSRLVFKVRSEARYATSSFPLKLRPLEDELLSSWLIRLALLHRTVPSTFANLYLPETKNKLWAADIDLQACPDFLAALSQKSGIPIEHFQAMTLKSYEGYLFEKARTKTGGTPFVNPLGMRGRRNKLPGVRFCPLCLREGPLPYFRKKWRLSFYVACSDHHSFLLDRCQECGVPITPYVACTNGHFGTCHACGKGITGQGDGDPASTEILAVVRKLQAILSAGYVLIAGAPIYSHLYFIVLHQMLKLLMSRKYGESLCAALGIACPSVDGKRSFEAVAINSQAQLLIGAARLLEDWPTRFVHICGQQGILSSRLFKDLRTIPFWYWKVVVENLYRPDRVVTDEEICAALRYMECEGMAVSELALSRLLGVRQVFRKRKQF